MRLKAACWAFAALTFLLLLGWPSLVGMPPKNASKPVIRQYLLRSELFFGVMLGSFLITTVLAALVVKQYREEFVNESATNLKMLVEGTLQDHKKKSGAPDEQS